MGRIKLNSDFRDLFSWIDGIKTNLASRQVDQWLRIVLTDAANEFIEVLMKNTPVGPTYYKIYLGDEIPGTLRNAWKTDNINMSVIKRNTGLYEINIVNKTKYASWVNYGHYQQVGRFVYTIKAKLKKPYVSGSYFMELSEKEFQQDYDNVIKRLVEAWLTEVFRT